MKMVEEFYFEIYYFLIGCGSDFYIYNLTFFLKININNKYYNINYN